MAKASIINYRRIVPQTHFLLSLSSLLSAECYCAVKDPSSQHPTSSTSELFKFEIPKFIVLHYNKMTRSYRRLSFFYVSKPVN